MSKPDLVTPHRSQGNQSWQVSSLTFINISVIYSFFIFSSVIFVWRASRTSPIFAILRTFCTVQLSVPVSSFCISIRSFQKTGQSSYRCWKDPSSSSQNLRRGVCIVWNYNAVHVIVKERFATDFEAHKLWKGRSGQCQWIAHLCFLTASCPTVPFLTLEIQYLYRCARCFWTRLSLPIGGLWALKLWKALSG